MSKTLVFDWNCTLLNDTLVMADATNVVLDHFKTPRASLNTIREAFEMPIHVFFERLGIPTTVSLPELALIQKLFLGAYLEKATDAPLREGALDLLEEAKREGAHLIILSNHIKDDICARLRAFAIEDHFAEVIAYGSQKEQFRTLSKGDKLALYLKDNGLSTASTVIVGDTPEETEIAHKYGYTAVALQRGYSTPERLAAAKPHITISELTDLSPHLRARGFFACP